MSLLAEIAEGLAALLCVALLALSVAFGIVRVLPSPTSPSTTDIAPRCADAPQPCKRRV